MSLHIAYCSPPHSHIACHILIRNSKTEGRLQCGIYPLAWHMLWIGSKPWPQEFVYYGTSFVWIPPKYNILQVCSFLNSICYMHWYPPFHQPCCCCNYWLEWNVFGSHSKWVNMIVLTGRFLKWQESPSLSQYLLIKTIPFSIFFIHTAWLDVVLQGYF